MLVIFRTVKPKHLKADYGLTWAKCAYYRHNFLTVLLRSFSVNISNLVDSSEEQNEPVSNDRMTSSPGRRVKRKSPGKVHVSVVEKVRERFSVDSTKRKRSRTFTATELEEEEKFAQLLSKEFEKNEDDDFGHLRTEKSGDLNDRLQTEDDGYHVDRSYKKTHRLPADWGQKFGTLATKDGKRPYKTELDPGIKYMKEIKEEEEESKLHNHMPLGNKNRKHEPDWYSRRIVKLGQKGNIAEAIAVFDDWMIKRDRVKPTDYEYSVLISLLGKVGYTKKAFSLFNEMIRKDYKINPTVYTALFNACSNNPWPEVGLKKARDLRRHMLVKNKHPSYITYQAMIKTFGRCGDLNTAFELADETAHFYRVNDNLLSSLLYVCISEKEAGFRHAIMVWRKFQKTDVVPTIRDYKLLLRCAKDCGIGDQKQLQQLLFVESETPGEMKGLLVPSDKESIETIDAELTNNLPGDINLSVETVEGLVKDVNAIEDITDVRYKVEEISVMPEDKSDSNRELYDTSDITETLQLKDMDLDQKNSEHSAMSKKRIILPSVLDPNADFSQVLSLSKVESRQDRFSLLGNIDGFMKHLREHDIKPDLHMFTLILVLVPIKETDLVLDELLKSNLTPDVGFCNSFLYRLINAGRNIEDVLEVMKELKIKADIGTYMQLAFGCKNTRMAKAFLEAMKHARVMPTRHVMNNLITASTINFPYKTFVLQQMMQMEIKPNKWCLTRIEDQISHARQQILEMDKGKIGRKEDFIKKFDQFLTFYDNWTKHTDVQEEEHPWKQFKIRKDE